MSPPDLFSTRLPRDGLHYQTILATVATEPKVGHPDDNDIWLSTAGRISMKIVEDASEIVEPPLVCYFQGHVAHANNSLFTVECYDPCDLIKANNSIL